MNEAGGLRAAVLSALAIDRSGFAPVIALRGAAGVAIPFAIGAAVGHPTEGVIAAAGPCRPALPALAPVSGPGPRRSSQPRSGWPRAPSSAA